MEELNNELRENAPKKKRILKIALWLGIFLIIAGLIFSSKALTTKRDPESWIYKIPIIGQIKHLAESADKTLKGEDRDRINVLLLGMGGENHDGGYLTDTIMILSLEPSTKKVAMISIPRDLTIPMEGMGWKKINNVNAYAEMEEKGSGGLASAQAVSDVFNLPIDYFVRVDFQGFINVVDDLGGIEVNVPNTLEDYKYPVLGNEDNPNYNSRYEHLYVEKGIQKMDGSLALKYARSRHAAGAEGSDFARARRQQLIMESVKEQLLSKNILTMPIAINNVINELQNHVSTNLKVWEMVKLWNMFKDVDQSSIITKVLDNSQSGLLVDARGEDGAYILVPRSGDFNEIQYLMNNIFSSVPAESQTKIKTEKATVEVMNGTWVNGLASQKALDLERYGFDVIRVANSSQKNFQKSVIYDLTFNKKSESLQVLKEKTGANVTFNLPQWLQDDIKNELSGVVSPEQPDFILILGQDADTTGSGTENSEK